MRVAVLGAGYAGLTVARRLERGLPDGVELVVVDDTGEHLVKHELHRVVRRPSLAGELRVPLAELLARATVREATVTGVAPESGTASLSDGSLHYDFAAVCLGAEADYHGIPGLEAHATPLQRADDALAIRRRFLELLDDGGRVVVGGAGLSGIQVAGELAELAGETAGAANVDVVVVEQLPHVAPGFPGPFQRAVREELGARGVEVRTGTTVTGATEEAVETDDGTVAHDQLVWTGGIRGPDALAGSRRAVPSTLRLGSGTFVLGDAARIVDRDGSAVPATAQAALREAPVAAGNIRRLVEARLRDGHAGAFDPRLEHLAFEPRGWVVSVGDAVVAQVGPTVLRGPAARAVKATAGIGHLTDVGRVRSALAGVYRALE